MSDDTSKAWIAGRSRREFLGFVALLAASATRSIAAELYAERLGPSVSKATLSIFSTYLLHFARLTTYPAPPEDKPYVDPFVIGVIGVDPFGSVLDEVFKGEHIGARPVIIRRISNDGDVAACHLLYIGSLESGRVKSILGTVNGKPILTMSAAAGFVDIGGMVGLRELGDKAVFELNLDRSEAAGLRFDSRLLRIAKRILRTR